MASPPLTVLYQDEALLVLDKPWGIHTAPLRRGETGTLLDMVIGAFPEVASLPGLKAVEPGLVHRLDRDTSGVVVVARTPQAFDELRALFASGRAHKGYLAGCATIDEDSPESLRIESRFAPYGKGRTMVRVVLEQEASPRAVRRKLYTTEARVLSRAPGRVLLLTRIDRGFRHQIRAHLSFLGYPILGDPLYGAPLPEGFPARMYLHARDIELVHPVTKKVFCVSSPLPQEFDTLFPGGEIT
jgi:23S rRNA pseudouridine1911/1915/1917 synthase